MTRAAIRAEPRPMIDIGRAKVDVELLRSLVDDSDCKVDHGGCQAHGYLALDAGQLCPQAELKAVLAGIDHPKSDASNEPDSTEQDAALLAAMRWAADNGDAIEEAVERVRAGMQRFTEEMRDKGIHVGLGSPARCVTCTAPWPCEESKS